MKQDTTSPEFFEEKYREKGDPWNFARSEYEQSRYAAIIAALDGRRYQRAYEPGCSVGELTYLLAKQCDRIDAMDISETAVARARQRCAEFANTSILCGTLPRHIPDGTFDLIVFSEIGYYFDEQSLQRLGDMLVSRICTSGTLLAAHWLGSSKDHLLSGDRVHEILGSLSGLQLERTDRHTGFRLERWTRV